MILDEKEMYNDTTTLNENALTDILVAILALPCLVTGFVAYILIKEKNKYKQYFSDYINAFPECKELASNIKSTKNISIYELCRHLNVKDYKTKFPKAEYEDLDVKGIFDKNDKLIAYGILSHTSHKIALGVVDKKYSSNENTKVFLGALLEYHFGVMSVFYDKMTKKVDKLRKSSDYNKANKNDSKIVLKRGNDNDVPNMTDKEFDTLLKEIYEVSNLVFRSIKSSKLYNVLYKHFDEENTKSINSFKNRMSSLKTEFDKGKSIKNGISINLILNDGKYYESDNEINYKNYEEQVPKDAVKILANCGFTNDRNGGYRNSKYPHIHIGFSDYDESHFVITMNKFQAIKYTESNLYEHCIFLNEGLGNVLWWMFIGLPMVFFAGIIIVADIYNKVDNKKRQSNLRQDIADFINAYPECQKLMKDIKSIHGISIYELCRHLDVKDYKTKFPNAQYSEITVEGIFNKNQEMIAYAVFDTSSKKFLIGITKSEYRQDTCAVLLTTILERKLGYTTNNGYDKMKKMLAKIRKDSSFKKSKKSSVNKNFTEKRSKEESNKIPNTTSEEFNEMLEEYTTVYKEMYNRITKSKLYSKYYKSSEDFNKETLENFIKNKENLKQKFEKGLLVSRREIVPAVNFHLYDYDTYEELYDRYDDKEFNMLHSELKNLVPNGYVLAEKRHDNADDGYTETYKSKKENSYIEYIYFHDSGTDVYIRVKKSYFLKNKDNS